LLIKSAIIFEKWYKKLIIPENIILLFQPPYYPKLNPIERLWEKLKKEIKWSCFKTLEELKAKVDELFKELTPPEGRFSHGISLHP
jgi:transposase